ncbi:MAG: transcriptional regulator, partial [Bacteroidales bacterium]|nr:transcriptional regulator [Bacteroidales bacterium]
MKKIILLSLLVWESVMVYAAWQAPLINYTPKEYGAGTQNWHILQHNNGWMYFGNNNGLLEFDGNTWNNYGLWNGSVVRAMAVGEDGRIYVGGSNEFGVFTANELGKLSYKRLSDSIPEKYRNFGEAWNILLLHNELYVQTHNYIFIMDEENHFSVVEPRSHIFCSAKI